MGIYVGKAYDDGPQFIALMQHELPARGIRISNRLYRIVGKCFDKEIRLRGGEEEEVSRLIGRKPKDWDGFCQFLYERKLIAARVTGFVPHRPRNLGSRPPWIAEINAERPSKQGQAIRHIVPSHLLGYAVENAVGDLKEEFGEVLDAFGGAYDRWKKKKEESDRHAILVHFDRTKPAMREVPRTDMMARRWLWALLYNHPGNLWVGDANANQVIGFMYAAAYGVLRRLQRILEVPSELAVSPQNFGLSSPVKRPASKPPKKAAPTVGEALNTLNNVNLTLSEEDDSSLRDDIQRILNNVENDVKEEDIASISEMLCFVEDVAANLEFDIPALEDWNKVQEWRTVFTRSGISVEQMVGFLECDFSESLTVSKK